MRGKTEGADIKTEGFDLIEDDGLPQTWTSEHISWPPAQFDLRRA